MIGKKSATLESEKSTQAKKFRNTTIAKVQGKAKSEVIRSTFSHFLITAPRLFFLRFSEMNGTKFTVTAFVKTQGIYKSGIIIPLMTPSTPVASARVRPFLVRRNGIKMFEAEDKMLSAVLDSVTGRATLKMPERTGPMRPAFIPAVCFLYAPVSMTRLKSSPINIPKVSTAAESVMSPFEKKTKSRTTESVRRSCSEISVTAGIFTHRSE